MEPDMMVDMKIIHQHPSQSIKGTKPTLKNHKILNYLLDNKQSKGREEVFRQNKRRIENTLQKKKDKKTIHMALLSKFHQTRLKKNCLLGLQKMINMELFVRIDHSKHFL